MWECIYQLESEKFDLTEKMKRQKYEVSRLPEGIQSGPSKMVHSSCQFLSFSFQINVLLNRIQHAQKL